MRWRVNALTTVTLGSVMVAWCSYAEGPWKTTPGGLEVNPKAETRPELPMGPFVRLGDGAVLAVNDESQVQTSHDEGKTWDHRPLFKPGRDLKVSPERALLRTKDGVLILVFMNYADYVWKWNQAKSLPDPETRLDVWSIRSPDDGKTWDEPQRMYIGYCGAIRSLLQTKSGRVVVPVSELLYDEGRHAARVYYSDDAAKTWKKANLLDIGGRGHHDGLLEPTLAELRDGRLWLLCRTNFEQFWSVYSDNDGASWRVWQPSGIAASSAPGQLARLASGRLILAWNRVYPEGTTTWRRSGGDNQWSEVPVSNYREEMSIAFSEDDGKTWTKPIVIARKAKPIVSYPYLFEAKPGELWITTMQGDLRAAFKESDFNIK